MSVRIAKLLQFLLVGTAIVWVFCAGVHWLTRESSGYQSVPLVKGAGSIRLALAGVAIDPTHHTAYAIVGDRETRERTNDFVILWKATDGKNYCAKLSREGDRLGPLDGTRPAGEIKRVEQSTKTVMIFSDSSPTS